MKYARSKQHIDAPRQWERLYVALYCVNRVSAYSTTQEFNMNKKDMQILKKEIAKMELAKGDTLVLKLYNHERYSKIHIQTLNDHLKTMFPDNKIIIMDNRSSFHIIKKRKDA